MSSDASPDFLIDKILPSKEIHLLAGPTGAGKTRWLFNTLLQWQAGNPILGFPSHPVPWIYVSSDRSGLSVQRTLDSMNIDPAKIPLINAWDRAMTINAILEEVENSGAKLAVIESFGSFVPPPANANVVKSFLRGMSIAIQRSGLTIIGVVESPKMKPKDRYSNPRQRVSGVASWGHFSETIMLVEPTDADEGSPYRSIHVCPRNAAEIKLYARFGPDGYLLPVASKPKKEKS